MKNLNLFIAILVLSVTSHANAGFKKGQLFQGKGNRNVQMQALTTDEQNNLIYMREEEKLARDVFNIWCL